MAAITSAASGNWSAAGTWAGGVVPTTTHEVTIGSAHTVTIDTTSAVANTLTVNGGLTWLNTADTTLTLQRNLESSATAIFTCDYSAAPTLTAKLLLNAAATAGAATSRFFSLNNVQMTFKGAPRTRRTTLTAAITAGATSATVAAANEWRVGDIVVFATTQAYNATPRTDRVTLTSVSGGSIGWTGGITYDHANGGYVGNFSSNVVIGPAVAGGDAPMTYKRDYSTFRTKLIEQVQFLSCGCNDYNQFAAFNFLGDSSYVATDDLKLTLKDNAFYDFRKSGIQLYSSFQPASYTGNVFYSETDRASAGSYHRAGIAASRSNTGGLHGVISGGGVFRVSCPNNAGQSTGQGGYCIEAGSGVAFSDLFASGCSGALAAGIALGGPGHSFENVETFSNNIGITYGEPGSADAVNFHNGTFNAGACTNGTDVKINSLAVVTLRDSKDQTSGTINAGLSAAVAATTLAYVNKNQDVTQQEIYRRFMTVKRDNGVTNRSTSSVAIYPTKTATDCTRTVSIPCTAGSSVTVVGYIRRSNADVTVAKADLTGLGASGQTFTSAVTGQWEKYTFTATNGTGVDGNYTLTYTANAATAANSGTAYFDGVPDSPFVVKARHYGYTMDEANPARTVNPVSLVSEATAIAYTGVTVTGTQITVGAGTANTWAKLYAYMQAHACANLTSAVNLTSTDGNNFALPLTYKLSWPGMGNDGTLSGGWLLLSTPGTLNYKLSGTKIEFQTAGNYDMGGTAFSGTVEFVNSSGGAVTVAVPAGTSYTNTGPSITVTVPTVTQGLAFTGLVAGSQVKVFDTGTTTELFSDSSSATSETWSQAGGTDATVDYTIQKAGYLPIRVVGVTVNSAVLPTPVQQSVDRSYVASSGLAFGTTATVDTGTSRFAVTTATTGQNWYSFMIESWIAQSALRNVAFPVSSNGPNSFTLDGWEFSAGLSYLYRDGLRYTSAGSVTAIWAAIYSVDTAAGLQIKYQQTDGGTTVNAASTGKIDQLVQVYGDASHGNFDKRTFLALKVQADGYDQAQTDVVATYGTLEDQLYVIGLNPASNGLTTGAPTVNGSPTITDHGASPVTWHGKAFSLTITDSATGNTGETLMRWIRYNLAAGGTFQGKDAFNWHDLVQTNGTSFKTVRGNVYGDTGAALKGVRVITSTGADHPDFNLHTADDGTTYAPTFPANAAATVLANSRVQLYNVTTAAEIDSQFVTGTAYSYTVTAGVIPGDTLRLRACKKGYEAAEATALWVAGGVTFLLSQNADAVYSSWGIDGATVTEYALDGTNIQIDANDVDGATEKTRLGAFYSYALTTEAGIRTFYGAMTFLSSAAIRINVGVVNLKIDNINATTALYFTDLSVRLYRSDGSSIIAPSSYSIHNDYSGVPDVVETGVSGLTGAESSQLLGLPSAAATASAVLAAASTTPIAADIKKVNAQTISGAGVEADPWGP